MAAEEIGGMGGFEHIKGPGSPGEMGEVGGPKALTDGKPSASPDVDPTERINTLEDLKKVLIKNLGEDMGTKVYEEWVKQFALSVLSQVRQAEARAKKAAAEMRKA